jgi:hypothetical protein
LSEISGGGGCSELPSLSTPEVTSGVPLTTHTHPVHLDVATIAASMGFTPLLSAEVIEAATKEAADAQAVRDGVASAAKRARHSDETEATDECQATLRDLDIVEQSLMVASKQPAAAGYIFAEPPTAMHAAGLVATTLASALHSHALAEATVQPTVPDSTGNGPSADEGNVLVPGITATNAADADQQTQT